MELWRPMVTAWSFPVALSQSPLGQMTPLLDFLRLQSCKHLQWNLLYGHQKLWLSLMTLQKIRQAISTFKISLSLYMPFSLCGVNLPHQEWIWLAHHKPVSCMCLQAHIFTFSVSSGNIMRLLCEFYDIELSCMAWYWVCATRWCRQLLAWTGM